MNQFIRLSQRLYGAQVLKPKAGEPIEQLYNLATDPSERNNLYGQHPEKVKELTDLLTAIKQGKRAKPE